MTAPAEVSEKHSNFRIRQFLRKTPFSYCRKSDDGIFVEQLLASTLHIAFTETLIFVIYMHFGEAVTYYRDLASASANK